VTHERVQRLSRALARRDGPAALKALVDELDAGVAIVVLLKVWPT
jgi:hypothetical protein